MNYNFIPAKTIVAGFPGIGKTNASLRYDNVIDLESSQFFFKLSDNMPLEDYEKLKGDKTRQLNPNGLDDYVKAIIEAHNHYDYVFIAMFPELLERLYKEGLDVQLVLPAKSEKSRYERKYRKRGNQDNWINNIMNNWEHYIDSAIKNNRFSKEPIILEKWEYWRERSENLSDIIDGRIRFNPYDMVNQFEKRLKEITADIEISKNNSIITIRYNHEEPLTYFENRLVVYHEVGIDLTPKANNYNNIAQKDDIEVVTGIRGRAGYIDEEFSHIPIKNEKDRQDFIDYIVKLINTDIELFELKKEKGFKFLYHM